VHEGFTIAAVVNTLTQLMQSSPDTIVLTFDVTPYASLDVLGKFLHHLYVFGLLFDEETGQVSGFDPKLTYQIFLELPALSFFAETEDQVDLEWPTQTSRQKTKTHPFLAKLPVLSLAVPSENHIFIDIDTSYLLSPEARLVASYWRLHTTIGLDNVPQLPTCPLDDLPDAEISHYLVDFFLTYQLKGSKREQTNVLKLLNDRVLYLAKLQAAAKREYVQSLKNPLIFTFYERFQGHFDAIFRLLIKESVDTGSDSSFPLSVQSGKMTMNYHPWPYLKSSFARRIVTLANLANFVFSMKNLIRKSLVTDAFAIRVSSKKLMSH
jgi:hypothetical protein